MASWRFVMSSTSNEFAMCAWLLILQFIDMLFPRKGNDSKQCPMIEVHTGG